MKKRRQANFFKKNKYKKKKRLEKVIAELKI